MPFKGQDAVQFKNLMTGIAATFNRQADMAFMIGYEMALEDLPIRDIATAVARAIRECEFMPTGARLRELAGVVPLETRAAIAWGCLRTAIATHGAYASICFDDTAINATVRNLGGWERLCGTEAGDEFDKWLRKEFECVYVGFCKSGCSAEMAGPLIGICDRDNSAAGYVDHVEAPKLIETGLKRLPHLPEPRLSIEKQGSSGLIPEMKRIESPR